MPLFYIYLHLGYLLFGALFLLSFVIFLIVSEYLLFELYLHFKGLRIEEKERKFLWQIEFELKGGPKVLHQRVISIIINFCCCSAMKLTTDDVLKLYYSVLESAIPTEMSQLNLIRCTLNNSQRHTA